MLLVGISLRLIEAATSFAFLMRLDIALLCPVWDLEMLVSLAGLVPVPKATLNSTIFSFNEVADLLSTAMGVLRGVARGVGGPSSASSLVPACNEEEVLQLRNGNIHGKCSGHVNSKHRRH